MIAVQVRHDDRAHLTRVKAAALQAVSEMAPQSSSIGGVPSARR